MKKKLLLADDDQVLCVELRDVLEDAGYDVTVVGDGGSALACLESRAFDLLLLDLNMPVRDGFSVLERVHNEALVPRVLIVSGQPRGEVPLRQCGRYDAKKEALLATASAVLGKPVPPVVLLETIAGLLRD